MLGKSVVRRVAAMLVGLICGTLHSTAADVVAATDFREEVAPILQEKCVECHDASMQMAELRLDSRQAMLDGGAIVPGDAENSMLVQRLKDRELGILMPPTGKLDKAEVDTLTKWVDAGAVWPEGVSLASQAGAARADARSKAIFAAIRAEDLQALKLELGDKSLVHARSKHRATPLMHAALYARVESVTLLLDNGADPNAADHGGMTALMYAAGGDPAKTRLLLDRGAKVDTQSKLGRTALLMASAFAGNQGVVKALLDAGADVNYADRRKWTATVLAARTGDVEMVRMLLDAGGDVNGGDSNRLSPGTPLMQAAWASDVECSKLLLARGANTDHRSVNSALIFAATHGSSELLELLLDAGAAARANVVTNYIPESPILAASYSDSLNVDIVRILLKQGVDIEKPDKRGETPLSMASQRGRSEIVALLRGSETEKEAVRPAADKSDSKDLDEQAIKRVAQKSVSLLESCGPKFFASSGCTACHQQTAASLLVRMARARGLDVDEQVARQQTKLTSVDLGRSRAAYLQRMKSGGTAHRLAYLLWGLAAADYPADEITDAAYIEVAGLQLHNGSWVSDAHRPPSEYSPITATAVSLHAVQLYHPPGLKLQADKRVARAKEWLVTAPARANAEKAFRLLGLHWGGADRTEIAKAKEDLLKDQASNGGWSQLPTLEPDAYATGLTLYALGQSGAISAGAPEYGNGVAFLMDTVKDDGTWHVQSRSFKFQPYFESGFPYEHDQWISAAATGWAAMALLRTIEPTNVARSTAKPFVEYPSPVASYLEHLHGKDDAERSKGELAFRPDYPGGFAIWQRDARKKLTELLGLERIKRDTSNHQPKVQVGDPIQEAGYIRRRGELETEPGVTIPFWLLTPDGESDKPRPLVICAHGHDRDGWNTYAGVYRDDEHRTATVAKDGDVGVQSVKRGYVTIVPATRGLAADVSVPDVKGRHGKRDCRAQLIHCLLAGRTAVGERVWDTQRLLDWALANVNGIDVNKVVLLGNSGGGVLTVYAAALDERITVAVPSCSFTSYTSSNGFVFHCDCCLVPRAAAELGDMADIGALTAPRSLLAVHGRKDTLHSFADVEAAMARVQEIYAAANSSDHFQFTWGAEGHRFYPDIMWPFIDSAKDVEP